MKSVKFDGRPNKNIDNKIESELDDFFSRHSIDKR